MENTGFTMPRLGDPAPAFTASTTEGPINFPADFKGRWIILFSHPADFTPVCTSEFMTFGSMQKELRVWDANSSASLSTDFRAISPGCGASRSAWSGKI